LSSWRLCWEGNGTLAQFAAALRSPVRKDTLDINEDDWLRKYDGADRSLRADLARFFLIGDGPAASELAPAGPEEIAELARLRLRYVDCGRKDEYGLDVGARVFTQRLRDQGLEVRHEEFPDDHRNVGYRYAVSLPALAAVLERE